MKIDKLKEELHKAQKQNNIEKQIELLKEIADQNYEDNDYEKAKRNLKAILEIDNKIKEINYLLAVIEISQNNKENAKKYLKKELKISPNKKAEILLEKIEIDTNLPIFTILIFIISIAIFFKFSNNFEITYVSLLKYTLNKFNMTIFSAITSVFMHINLIHLTTNMLMLLIFGIYLEKYIGSLKFITIFLLSAVIGNYLQAYLATQYFTLGSSAGVFGILGAIVMREPLLSTRLFGIIKIPIIILMGAIFTVQAVIIDYVIPSNVLFGDIAHIFGFLCATFLMSIFYSKKIGTFYNWLAIAIGFWIIMNTIKDITNNINYETIIISTSTILVGAFLIIYSYIKLKYVTQSSIENETNN